MEQVSVAGARGQLPLLVAEPEGEGPRPAVVVVHDALGVTADLRRQCEWLAGAGYLAVAPDLYYWGGRGRCLFRTMKEAAAGEGPLFDDLETARAWAAGRADCTGRVGVIGFCLGGGIAVLLAPREGYGAASVNYGGVPEDAADLLATSCPVVGSYGGRDPTLRKDPDRLRAALEANGVPHDVEVYPEAGHAFLNDHHDMPLWAVVMGRLSRSAYHEPSAVDARRRIEAFFASHLRDRPPVRSAD